MRMHQPRNYLSLLLAFDPKLCLEIDLPIMWLFSKLFRKDERVQDEKLSFVNQWIMSDLEEYSPRYPIHDPLVVSSPLDFVTLFFLTLGAEFPERVRELIIQTGRTDQETELFLDSSQNPPSFDHLNSIEAISEVNFRYQMHGVSEKYLHMKGVPFQGDDDPISKAFEVGLDWITVMAIFNLVALNSMRLGYLMPSGISELVAKFLKSETEKIFASGIQCRRIYGYEPKQRL